MLDLTEVNDLVFECNADAVARLQHTLLYAIKLNLTVTSFHSQL